MKKILFSISILFFAVHCRAVPVFGFIYMRVDSPPLAAAEIQQAFTRGLRPASPIDNGHTAGVDFWNFLTRPLTHPSLLTAHPSIQALRAAADEPLNGIVFRVQIGANFYDRYRTMRRFNDRLTDANDPSGNIRRLIRDIYVANRAGYLIGFDRAVIGNTNVFEATNYQNGVAVAQPLVNPAAVETNEVPREGYPFIPIYQTFNNEVEVTYTGIDRVESLLSTIACGLGFGGGGHASFMVYAGTDYSCAHPKVETVEQFNSRVGGTPYFPVINMLLE